MPIPPIWPQLTAPLTYSQRRNHSDFVVRPEDAEAFAKRLGGELFRADH